MAASRRSLGELWPPPSKTDPDVAEKRTHWHEQLANQPVQRLLFVGESGANTKMTRLRGRRRLPRLLF